MKTYSFTSALLCLFIAISLKGNGQSFRREVCKAVDIYLAKNDRYLIDDTLFFQNNNSYHIGITNECVKKKIVPFDIMPKVYFKESKFVMGISVNKDNKILKIVLTEKDFRYEDNIGEWKISYLGQWEFYFAKKKNRYFFKKYVQTGI